MAPFPVRSDFQGATSHVPLVEQPQKVDSLLNAIGASKRGDSSEEKLRRFVEPAAGTLQRVLSKHHHVVLGRRGSGKTSLLRKAEQELGSRGIPVAFVDLDVYKRQAFPNLIASVLRDAFQQYLSGAFRLPLPRQAAIVTRLRSSIAELGKLLTAPDQAEGFSSLIGRNETEREREGSGGFKHWFFKLGFSGKRKTLEATADRFELKFFSSKEDTIQNNTGYFRNTINAIATAFGNDLFLLLDELYHVPLSLQPTVLDYFHGLLKNNHAWLKIGTVKHRSKLMLRAPNGQQIGLQLSQDADPINLDASFENFAQTERFLVNILSSFVHDADLMLSELATEMAVKRLVQSSGGVARDFLTLFSRAINVCRERLVRNPENRQRRISADDVWDAAAEFNTERRNEFRNDVNVNPADDLIATVDGIRKFCYANDLNCVLIEDMATGVWRSLIDEIWDSKLLHTVKTGLRLHGELHTAYMLDVSEQATDRERRKIILDLSEDNVRERLMQAKLILRPETPNASSH